MRGRKPRHMGHRPRLIAIGFPLTGCEALIGLGEIAMLQKDDVRQPLIL